MSVDIDLALEFSGFSLAARLQLPGQGVTALFGPSGSGKTTLLRCLAGLERARGRLVVAGDCWQDDSQGRFRPTHQRALGYVFQEASLFPHLTVQGNLEFGWRRVPPAQRRVALAQAVALLDLQPLLQRRPDRLSGGERQRVAMARALLTSPNLLLLDEPLAALDQRRKNDILPYLERLRTELALPMIYVSHSADEVARLADHLVLLEHGQVVGSGPLLQMLARIDLPPAFADDAGVVLECVVGAHDDEDSLTRLVFAGGAIQVARRPEPIGTPLRCRVHARDVSLALSCHADSSILNRLPARVTAIADTDQPAQVLVQLDVGGVPLIARITRRSLRQLAIQPGLTVWAQIKSVALL